MKYKLKKLSFGTGLISTLLLSQSALVVQVEAEIFKCTNDKGSVYYNDKPCPVSDKEKVLQNEKDVVNGYVPQALEVAPSQKRRVGVSVGGVNTREIENTPETDEDRNKDEDSGSSGSKGGAGKPSGGSSSAKGFMEDLATGSYDSSHDIDIDVEPPPSKSSDTTKEQKLSLKQKKLILDIHPEDQ